MPTWLRHRCFSSCTILLRTAPSQPKASLITRYVIGLAQTCRRCSQRLSVTEPLQTGRPQLLQHGLEAVLIRQVVFHFTCVTARSGPYEARRVPLDRLLYAATQHRKVDCGLRLPRSHLAPGRLCNYWTGAHEKRTPIHLAFELGRHTRPHQACPRAFQYNTKTQFFGAARRRYRGMASSNQT